MKRDEEMRDGYGGEDKMTVGQTSMQKMEMCQSVGGESECRSEILEPVFKLDVTKTSENQGFKSEHRDPLSEAAFATI